MRKSLKLYILCTVLIWVLTAVIIILEIWSAAVLKPVTPAPEIPVSKYQLEEPSDHNE